MNRNQLEPIPLEAVQKQLIDVAKEAFTLLDLYATHEYYEPEHPTLAQTMDVMSHLDWAIYNARNLELKGTNDDD